ncbi:hypothetical protein [Faecalibaculum rodentium]|uniref:hypothetical protein n=1 Tax=Faecalibaculum rodentium TaxID=1702221 RepID=UPI0027306638|nr:hypothetical protein [Faecalibaculum rodentium]
MIIDEILTAAGFVKNRTYKETRFLSAPKQEFCVWSDQVSAWGSDLGCRIKRHSVTIELYTYDQASTAESRIETELSSRFPEWEKFEKDWLTDGQFFMTTYMFDYLDKS